MSLGKFITIDFETRSGFDIKKGATPYAQNCEAICLAVKPLGKPVSIFRFDEIEPIAKKLLVFSKKNYIVAHNSVFDFKVFQKITGCPDKAFSRWFCSQALSLFCGGPDKLWDCCNFWDLKQKKTFGKNLIQVLSIPYSKRTPISCEGVLTKNFVNKESGYVENEHLFKKMEEYCMQDVRTTEALVLRLEKFIPYFYQMGANKNIVLNYLRNKRGLNFNLEKVELLAEAFEQLSEKYSEVSKKITKDSKFNIDSWQQVLAFLKKYGYSPKTTQLKDMFQLKPKEKVVKNIIRMRLTRPSSAGTKYREILKRNSNGILHDTLFFHGAFTGRYTSVGLTTINMPRSLSYEPEVFKQIKEKTLIKKHKFDTYKILKGSMRQCLIPHKGCEFVGGDFSAIELKLLLACSGDKKSLKRLQKGWDAYVFMASKVFKKEEKDVTKEERYVAKRATLAFGYGLSHHALIELLHKDEIVIDEAKALEFKKLYFNTFPLVKEFWYEMYKPFRHNKKNIEIVVPFSGKKLMFWDVRREHKTVKYDNGLARVLEISTRGVRGGRTTIYPSRLCGLIIQSLAVSLFQNVEVEIYKKLKLLVDLPVHDEFVCSAKKGRVSLNEFKECIETPPKWLPRDLFKKIDSEVWKGDFYKK